MSKIQVDNIQIAFDDSGTGPAVVLLHGFPFNRSLWNEQVAVLSGSHRVITPDLRGFGDSDAAEGPAAMSRMAEDVVKLMDALGISNATIGGLSMGGYVVLAFFKLFPERVKALVLADTRPQSDTEEGKQARAEQAKKVLSEGMLGIVNSMLPKLFTPESVSKRPDSVKRIRDMMIKTKPAGAAAALLGMAERADHTETLSGINVPTLILVGRDDAITPVADSENMQQRIPGSRLVIIENAGHVSNVEQADVFNAELKTFVDQIT
jgi:3-oxoadipate enol-lactonase